HDAGTGVAAHQGPGDRSGPGAEIDRRTVSWQPLHGATRQWLTLPAGNVDTRIDADFQAAERDPPRDPCQWLAREAARDQRVEELDVAGGARDELVGLLVCRDEPRTREHGGRRRRVVAHY